MSAYPNLSGSTRPLAPVPVSPGIHHQKHKDDETDDQKDHCPGIVLPELLEASGDFVKIHAKLIYTIIRKN
jgi:hypothetical protein